MSGNNDAIQNAGGCVDIITINESQIVRPAENCSISLSCDVEKPCFTIRNGYLDPVLKCYKIRFPNAIELKAGDEFSICIRVPRTIKGNKYEYLIHENVDTENTYASVFIRGTDDCQKFDHDDSTDAADVTTEASLDCGWLQFKLDFTLTEDLGDVCELEYAICFPTLKLTSLTRECECDELNEQERILYNCDPCVVLSVPPAPTTMG